MVKIVHCGDIHIRNLKYHDIYRNQFSKFYKKLKRINPDYITVVGDLVDNFVNISNEAKVLAGEFLNNLSNIANVIIVPGNHDLQKSNKLRTNSVETVVNLLANPNITYFGTSGFYENDDVIWVNYAHLEKDINPWDNGNIVIPENVKIKPTIGLFHDPIYGSSTDGGQLFDSESYKPIGYFNNNDFLLASDIHKQQYLRNDKSAFYSSSLIQQNFAELPYNHGFIELVIRDKTDFDVKFHDIPNEYNFITLNVGKNYNYDNITLDDDYLTPNSFLRINWSDYSANMTFENEQKLREYIKEKWGIETVKVEKNGINTDIVDVESINESVNVLDLNEQRKIFKEYLELNKFSEEHINEVLKIDDIINDRIVVEVNNGIDFSIEKLNIYNFKSYDEEEVDFKSMGLNKIIQIHGINQVGKSTLLDAICYVLYNKTFGTDKKQKAGDARFINNKRDIDECWVSAVLNINGEKYFIERKTTRKWNRDHSEITSAPTTMFFCKGEVKDENQNLTEEQKKDTQKIIEETIGTFESFVNKSFINGENLNSLLSMDRSEFIDGLIRDSGLGVFEQKLDEFKLYKKSLLETRKNININDTNTKIETLTTDTEVVNCELDELVKKIDDLEKDKKILVLEKENLISKLEKIDPEIENLNLTDIDLSIETENEKITKNKERLALIEKLKVDVENYDSSALDNKQEEVNLKTQEINDIKLEILQLDNNILVKNNEITQIENDINKLVTEYKNNLKSDIQDSNLELSKIREDFSNYINDYTNDINKKLSDIINEKTKISNEIENITNDGKKLKKENEDIESSTVCVMCQRPLDGVDMIHIHHKIDGNKTQMEELRTKILELKPKVKELDDEHNRLSDIITKIKSKDYTFDTEVLNKFNDSKSKAKTYKDKIEVNNGKIELIKENNNPIELEEDLKPYYIKKDNIKPLIKEIISEKSKKNTLIQTKNEELDLLKEQLTTLKEEKDSIDKKKEKIGLQPRIESEIDKSNGLIKEYNKQIEEYNSTLDKIQKNKEINEKITDVVTKIDDLEETIASNNEDRLEKVAKLKLYDSQLKELNKDIKEYNRQKAEDELLSSYLKCIHRDGLPTYILKKGIKLINNELDRLMVDVDFISFFDDNLELKMSPKFNKFIEQSILQGSGKERTFIALSLKIALRKMNNTSKSSILLLDEIMGKLTGDSVEEFLNLLNKIKMEIDKVFIIEHDKEVNADVILDIEKDNNGISHMKFN